LMWLPLIKRSFLMMILYLFAGSLHLLVYV
jgi:hypothetical protein